MGKKDEAAFFDAAYEESARRKVWKYYALGKSSRKFYEDRIMASCEGKTVLEYGCGLGSYAYQLAKNGASVIGIDISEYAIETASERAKELGLQNAKFQLMDAEMMSFMDSSFDIVCGTGILHHLDLNKALSELGRVMKPAGRAIFLEPLGHNPAINLFRYMTPNLRTEDEHPLVRSDLKLINKYFKSTKINYFSLAAFMSVPLMRTRYFEGLLEILDQLDRIVFQLVPAIGLLAWYSTIEMSKPLKEVQCS